MMRRFLALTMLTVFTAALGPGWAGPVQAPPAPVLAISPPTTGRIPVDPPEVDALPVVYWDSHLDIRVSRLEGALAAVAVGQTADPAPSVADLFEEAAASTAGLFALLSEVTDANSSLRVAIRKAEAAGHDTHRHEALTEAVTGWVAALRESSDPDLCRGVLPTDADAWPADRLAAYRPYVDCVADETAPKSARLAAAAADLTEALAQTS